MLTHAWACFSPRRDDKLLFFPLSRISNLKLFFFALHHKQDFCSAGNHFDHIRLTSYLNWTHKSHFLTMHVRPIWASHLNISPLWRTTEACCHPADPWSGQMKGREEEGWRVEGKLGPRSRKLICFLRPLPSLRGRPHTAHTRGALMWLRVHSMRLSSSATGSHIT